MNLIYGLIIKLPLKKFWEQEDLDTIEILIFIVLRLIKFILITYNEYIKKSSNWKKCNSC